MKGVIVCAACIACVVVGCNPMAQYKCRARQSEAKSTLGMIKIGEASYFEQHKAYTASTSDLGVTMAMRDYSLELSIKGAGSGYKATAKGDKPDTMGDEWTVDESGAVTAGTDKCAH
jgi:type IV pilus assembly protein PilA